jgi:hypothetical protein
MITVRYCDYYEPTRNDPAFYTWDTPEWVATVMVDDRLLEAWVVGEMRINLPNEDIIRYTDDLIHHEIDSDEKLHQLGNDDDSFDIWINNSWIELRDYEGQWIGDVWSGHVYHDVQEAVEAMEMLLKDSEFISEFPCKNPHFVVGSAQTN